MSELRSQVFKDGTVILDVIHTLDAEPEVIDLLVRADGVDVITGKWEVPPQPVRARAAGFSWFWNLPLPDPGDSIMVDHYDSFLLSNSDENKAKRDKYRALADAENPIFCTVYVDGMPKAGYGKWNLGAVPSNAKLRRSDGSIIDGLFDPGSQAAFDYVKQVFPKVNARGDDALYLDEVWGYNSVVRKGAGSNFKSASGVTYTNASWTAAMISMLDKMRQAAHDNGVKLGANIELVRVGNPYMPHVDSAMVEDWVTGWPISGGSPTAVAPRWWDSGVVKNVWRDVEAASARGQHIVLAGQSQANDKLYTSAPTMGWELQRMRASLTAYLMVAEPNVDYRYGNTYGINQAVAGGAYRPPWWYPEFDDARELGAPTSARREFTAGVWRRDFERGFVLHNLLSHDGSVVVQV